MVAFLLLAFGDTGCQRVGCNDPLHREGRSGRPPRSPGTTAAPPTETPEAVAEPPVPDIRIATVALAMDQTVSMRGFANRNSLDPVVHAIEQSLRQATAAESPRLTYLSMGDKLTPGQAKDILRPGSFNQARNDLIRALGQSPLADSHLTIVLTDGQPTGNPVAGARCTPLGMEDLAELSSTLTTALEQGSGVWLVLERLPFDGRVFLNCNVPTPEMKKSIPGLSCRGECVRKYKGDRVLLALFIAAKPAVRHASEILAGYLDKRPEATAIRLHPPSVERWAADGRPLAHLMTARGSKPLPVVAENAAQWRTQVTCPSRDAVVRACLRAAPPKPGKEISLVRLDPPVAQPQPARPGDLAFFPQDAAFEPSLSEHMRAWDYQDCLPVWPRYRTLVKAKNLADKPVACSGAEGTLAAEFVVACGCLRGTDAHVETAAFHQPYVNAVEEVVALVREKELAADEDSWHLHPDKINGLALLLKSVGQRWGQKFQGQRVTVSTLRLDVTHRARP